MRPCCEDLSNRSEPTELAHDLVVTICQECQAKHYELTVDPLELNLTGASL